MITLWHLIIELYITDRKKALLPRKCLPTMHLAWLLSGPLPLGNESNDLKILLLSFVATERRDERWQQRCGQR